MKRILLTAESIEEVMKTLVVLTLLVAGLSVAAPIASPTTHHAAANCGTCN